MSKNKTASTYDRLMEDTAFKADFDKGYKDFLLSELLCALMQNDAKSVRGLAKEVGLSPTVIQNIRSGKQDDIKMQNFMGIVKACGYSLILEKENERITLR